MTMKLSIKRRATTICTAGVTALLTAVLLLTAAPGTAKAHPAYAEKTGYPCAVCHQNPKGGGPLNKFGIKWVTSGMKAKPKK